MKLLVTGLLLGLVMSMVGFAQGDERSVTLINGAVVTGRVVSISDAGLEMMIGRTARTYPWYSLAPGIRYRLEQSYRMNLDGYLAGRNPSTLTNAPDPGYDPLNPDATVESSRPLPTTGRTGFDYTFFEPRFPVRPARNAAASAFPVEESVFWALQYGPQSNDVAVFVFPDGDAARMATAISWRGRPLAESAIRRTIGTNTYHVFSKKTYSGKNGDIAFNYELEWMTSTGEPRKYMLHADVSLAHGDNTLNFKLAGVPSGFSRGNVDVVPRSLLMEPAFQFGLLIQNEQVQLVGRLRVSQLSFIPVSGADVRPTVEIVDAQNRTQWRQQLAIATDVAPGEPTLRAELGSLRPGDMYTLKASVSLGPLLGEITHEQTLLVPDALKP